MHIAILVGRLEIGGAELAMIELARALAERRHRVVLYTLFDHANARTLLMHGTPALDQAELPAGFDYQPLSGPKSASFAGVAWQLLYATWRLRSLLRARRTQVLYSALNVANLLAWFAVRWRPVRLIWSFHGTDSRRSWEDATAMRLCALFSRTVPVAIAVSEAAQLYFQRAGVRPQRFVVIANGTDTARLRPDAVARKQQRAALAIADDIVLLGVVARVAPVKAPERLIAALQIACTQAPKLQAVWVGAGEPGYIEAVRTQAHAAGIEQKLRFVGPSSAVPALLNALDVFALLSHSEGAPKALAEAMATALPCVIDRHAGLETLGDAGIVVDADDAQKVAAALLQLVQNSEQRADLGKRARARIEAALTLEHTVLATEALFTATARQGAQRGV